MQAEFPATRVSARRRMFFGPGFASLLRRYPGFFRWTTHAAPLACHRPSQLPPVLRRAGDLAGRHLDATGRARVGRLFRNAVGVVAGVRRILRANSQLLLRSSGWRPRRPVEPASTVAPDANPV